MNTEQAANELIGELEENTTVSEAWISDSGASWINVCVLFNQRKIPMKTMELISEYGDLRIEGTDGEHIETVVFL